MHILIHQKEKNDIILTPTMLISIRKTISNQYSKKILQEWPNFRTTLFGPFMPILMALPLITWFQWYYRQWKIEQRSDPWNRMVGDVEKWKIKVNIQCLKMTSCGRDFVPLWPDSPTLLNSIKDLMKNANSPSVRRVWQISN